MLAGRVSMRAVWICCSRNSAASSMVTMRSSSGMKEDSTLRIVVFPAPVPPETTMFSRAVTHACNRSAMPAVHARLRTRSALRSGVLPKRRIDSIGPSTATGAITAFTREPSGRRASTMGDDSSMRRPTRLTIFSMMRITCAASLNSTGVRWSFPLRSTYTSLGVVTRMSEMVGSASSGSSGPRPNTSSSTSSRMRCLSTAFSSASSSSSSCESAMRTSRRTRSSGSARTASRCTRPSSFRWSANFSS